MYKHNCGSETDVYEGTQGLIRVVQ